MKLLRVAASVLAGLVMTGVALSANTTGECSLPPDRLLRRLEIDLPGDKHVTRNVDVPADTEILIEAFEKNIDARLEVRAEGAEVATADSVVYRFAPMRVVVPRGPARRVDVTAVGQELAHGSVDVRMYRLASGDDRRCVEFWRTMAKADAAFAYGDMIFQETIVAPPGASGRAYQTAADMYGRAVEILGAGGLDEALARLAHGRSVYYGLEHYDESVGLLRAAEARFEALHHDFGVDRSRFFLGRSLTYFAARKSDKADAARTFAAAKTLLREAAAGHLSRGERWEYALALAGIASVSASSANYVDAIADYRAALAAFEGQYEPENTVQIRQNLAHFESQLGRYQEALKIHHEILAEGDNLKWRSTFFVNLTNTAYLELKLGRYDAALRHYSDAYAMSERTQNIARQAASLHGLGLTYHAIGNYGEALSYLERALALTSAEQAASKRGNMLRAIANVLVDTGRAREAIARREEALRLAKGPLDIARVTLELIDDRIEAGDIAIAKSLTAPLLAARDMPDPTIRVAATLANARISLAEGDAARAARDASTAAEYYRTHDLVLSEFAALLVQARAACAAGARDQALDLAENARQRAEEVRVLSSNPTLRASLWRQLRPAFGFTIGLLARPNSCGGSIAADPLGALAVAEGSRSRALEDFRHRSTVDSGARNEQRRELFERLAAIRQQLETLSKTAAADDSRLPVLRADAARLRREIDLTGGLPATGRLRAEDLGPRLRTRIDALPKDTAVVEYWLGEHEAFAWLLTRGRVQLVDLGTASGIDTAARRVQETMQSWLKGSVDERVARARELHDLIIAPLPADLQRARTVYFIPDGALHAVPFAALAHGDRRQPRFLVDSHDIAVAPAFLTIGSDTGPRELRKNSTALVVVDPVYTRDDSRFTRATETVSAPQAAPAVTLRAASSWTRLPATAREATIISKLLDRNSVQVLSGFDASRDSLLGRDLSRYDILHFATHAVADTEAPQLSALVLSTVDAQGKTRVGEVFAGDIADQRLGAALVVLSGCETALGRAEAGEGLLGLRYAAHASGARAVIASLWAVEDAAGARLMGHMYDDVIGRDASPVAALSRAMRSARQSWKDPALWAAFDISIAGF